MSSLTPHAQLPPPTPSRRSSVDTKYSHAEEALWSTEKDAGDSAATSSTQVAVYPDDTNSGKSGPAPFINIPELSEKAASAEKPRGPPPTPRAVSKLVQFRLLFNTYRRLCTFVAIINAVGIALASTGHFNYAVEHSGAMVVGNLFASILVRNEVFARFLYVLCNLLFSKWPPVWFRLSITSILQHLGGIHSGCAGAGLAWLIWKVVLFIRNDGLKGPVLCAFGLFCCVVLAVTFIAAFPVIRNRYHNVFERSHRFFGWASLVITWVFVLLGTQWDSETALWAPNGYAIIQAQEFWLVIGMTVFIALPWTMTRRVPVEVEIPSSRKAAILKFNRGMQQGLLGRISHSAALEYHLFGLISEGPNADCHYMVCGVQGDFTKSLVDEPPKFIWTRELKLPHVSNTSKMYRKGLRVCTGTGIGSALSTCMQSPNWFLIWIGSDFVATFGSTIIGLVEKNIPEERRILWDSKQRGKRPDSMKLIEEIYKAWGAEVVFITSNYQGNKEMMEGCKSLGIPCYGTLWDF